MYAWTQIFHRPFITEQTIILIVTSYLLPCSFLALALNITLLNITRNDSPFSMTFTFVLLSHVTRTTNLKVKTISIITIQ